MMNRLIWIYAVRKSLLLSSVAVKELNLMHFQIRSSLKKCSFIRFLSAIVYIYYTLRKYAYSNILKILPLKNGNFHMKF